MPENSVISQASMPVTRDSLLHDLRSLGLTAGMDVVVHASMSRIGWIVDGAPAVIDALLAAVSPGGTVMMPAFSDQMTDPADWQNPPVPEAWWEVIRANTAAFDPDITPTRDMGAIAETFRRWPGARRSAHPMQSLAAVGPAADWLTQGQELDWPLGDHSPLGRLYRRDGKVLLIGVGYNRNSSLHLGEIRAAHRRTMKRRIPVAVSAGVAWQEIDDVADDNGRLFPRVGEDFEATGQVMSGQVGAAPARLMSQRALVDFSTPWFDGVLAS